MNFFELIVHFLTGYHDSTSMERFLGLESLGGLGQPVLVGAFEWYSGCATLFNPGFLAPAIPD